MSTNRTDIEQAGTGLPEGVTLGVASGKASVYGETPVVQAAAITIVATTGATTELADVETALNKVIVAITNFGISA